MNVTVSLTKIKGGIKMARMYFLEVNKEGRELEVGGIKEMYKLVECSCLDHVTLYTNNTGVVTIWIDDEGLLVNKKRNRGYAGNILISKANYDGEDIDLEDEDIAKIKNMIDTAPKSESNIIRTFIDNLDEILEEPIIETFNYDDINLVVSVSSNDVVNSFETLKKRETIEVIENYIASYFLGIVCIEDFFHELCKSYAEAIYLDTKEKNSFGMF